jgi:Lon protease-like protein
MARQRIPIFPLNYLILPGEKKFLHIFEERYKELLKDCLSTGSEFGVAVWLKNNNRKFNSPRVISEFGVSVKIVRILKTTERGETDLIVEGQNVFRLHDFESVARPKLYGSAEAEFISQTHLSENDELINTCNKFLKHLKKKPLKKNENKISIFQMAEVLQMESEEKIRLLQSDHLTARENILLNKARLENKILEAEEQLEGDFWLN